MRNYLLFIVFTVSYLSSFAHQYSKEIEDLIASEKYESAWKKIESTYADESPENTIVKTRFCLRYFSQTKFHQIFNFNDLDSSTTLLHYRQISPDSETIFNSFNPEKELLNARRKFPDNYNINLALGEYYYEVYVTYKNNWIKPKNEIQALYYYHFKEAYLHNIKTNVSLFAIGIYFLGKQEVDSAKQFLNKAIEINNEHAGAHYNLAYIYAQQDSSTIAIEHATIAFENYETKELKSDAASMIGILFLDKKKYADAINWLLSSDALLPGNFFVYESLLKSYLHLNKMPEADLIAKNLYYFDWKNAKIFNTLQESYTEVGKQNELYTFLQDRLKEQLSDKEYQGFVYIYLTQLSIADNDKTQATKYIDEATKCFKICYDKEHSIFKALDNLKKNF